jgi:hypothetical protein
MASIGSQAQEPPRWLLLFHQVPPKPDYLRVKVRRRLQRIGAAALKSTVYVLPNTADGLEDFSWLAREISAMGGSAIVCETAFVAGITDEEVEAMLNAEIANAGETPRAPLATIPPGSTWVTRTGVNVDRIASAWLIGRFIDPVARFKFVPARGYRPQAGELRFDMFEAEFTHEGDSCTFQTLHARFGPRNGALAAIGEIVHDIDCKDDRFARPETPGIASVIRGIVKTYDDDEQRLARGAAVFEDLYASLETGRA